MAENMSRMEAGQMAAQAAAAEALAFKVVLVTVISVADKTSNTSICNRLMKYSDSFSEEKTLSQISSMTKTISLVVKDLDRWEWVLIGKEPKNNPVVPIVKTEIHSAWVILLEACRWEAMTFSVEVDSEACR